MLRGIFVCAIAWFLLISTALLCAQSQQWKREHDKHNRWEGLVGEDQGGLDWELRSFLGDAVEPFPDNSDVDMSVAWYVPDEAKAFVTAQEISPALYYFMEPKPTFLTNKPGWRYFRNWHTVDVLLQKQIASSQLGILIRLGSENIGNTRLAPGLIYFSKLPDTIKIYHLDIFTMRAVRQFYFEVHGSNNYKSSYPAGPSGNRSIISLAFDASGIPEGPTSVLISAPHELQKDKLELQVDFYNKRLTAAKR